MHKIGQVEPKEKSLDYLIVNHFECEGINSIFTVSIDSECAVDVKICPETGLVYVMQNHDGSCVHHLSDPDVTFPDYSLDEAALISFVKETYALSQEEPIVYDRSLADREDLKGLVDILPPQECANLYGRVVKDGDNLFFPSKEPIHLQDGCDERTGTLRCESFDRAKQPSQIQYGIDDGWLHGGQKVKILNKYFADQIGSIRSFMWTTGEYIVALENGHKIPFRPSELEKVDNKKPSLAEQINSAADRTAYASSDANFPVKETTPIR